MAFGLLHWSTNSHHTVSNIPTKFKDEAKQIYEKAQDADATYMASRRL